MRTCTKCSLTKEDDEFSWSIKGIKRHSRCKSCRAEDKGVYYENNKEKELEYKYARQVRRREELRTYVFDYLKTHPCEHCGETDPLVLTFHHVRGKKKMAISQMVNQGYTLEAIQAEIDKCIVLCSNCHLREEKRIRGTKYE